MINLILRDSKTGKTKAFDVDEQTLSLVDRRYGKKKQELFKSILTNFIIDAVNSVQYNYINDRAMEVLLRDDPKLTIENFVSPFDDRLSIGYACLTVSNDVYQSFEKDTAEIQTGEYVKLLKAHHKDEALAYLLLAGIIK